MDQIIELQKCKCTLHHGSDLSGNILMLACVLGVEEGWLSVHLVFLKEIFRSHGRSNILFYMGGS
jgi:GTP-dependent phosphoenolpyruvate carboxykinase